jgi:hypothetical protein
MDDDKRFVMPLKWYITIIMINYPSLKPFLHSLEKNASLFSLLLYVTLFFLPNVLKRQNYRQNSENIPKEKYFFPYSVFRRVKKRKRKE